MEKTYHYSPKSGRILECKANTKGCKFQKDDVGIKIPHGSSRESVKAQVESYESTVNKLFDTTQRASKKSYTTSLGYKIAPINVSIDKNNTRNPTMVGRELPLRKIPQTQKEVMREVYKKLGEFYKNRIHGGLKSVKEFSKRDGLTTETLIPSVMAKEKFITLSSDYHDINESFFMEGSCASLAYANYHKLKSAGYENIKFLAYKESYFKYHVGIIIDNKDFYDYFEKRPLDDVMIAEYGKGTIMNYHDFINDNFNSLDEGNKYYDSLSPLDEFLLEYHSSNMLYNNNLIEKDNYVELGERIPEPKSSNLKINQPDCFDNSDYSGGYYYY